MATLSWKLIPRTETVKIDGKDVTRPIEPNIALINGVEFTVRPPVYKPKHDDYTKTNCVYADVSVLNTGVKYLFILLSESEGEFDIETASPEDLNRAVLEANTITLGVVRQYLSKSSCEILDELIAEAMKARKAERIESAKKQLEEADRRRAQLIAATGGKTPEERAKDTIIAVFASMGITPTEEQIAAALKAQA